MSGQRPTLWFFPSGPKVDPTPSDGPDPYGSRDPEWMRIDWQSHYRIVDCGGAQVHYVELSPPQPHRYRPLVFVHGLSGSWQNWLENLPHFARSRRVVALDLPGFGASPMPDWEISISAYGRLLHDFCAALELVPAVLVGNSMGGFVCAEATIAEPELVDRLVLVSAAGISHARMRREPAEMAGRFAVATSPMVLKLQQRGLRRPWVRRQAFQMICHRPLSLRGELLWEFFVNGAGKPGFVPAIAGLVGYDFLDRLDEVEVPTLVVWGRNDRIVPAADALEYARRLKNARVEIFDRTGHVPMAERPVRFNRTLEAFLAEPTPDYRRHPPRGRREDKGRDPAEGETSERRAITP